MKFSAVVATLASVACVNAATQIISVGENQGLTFNPSSITAAVGDTISFQFKAKNHTITQSTFAQPCISMANGVDSGFQVVAANATQIPQYSFTVNNATAPLWFFCRQTGHCQKGMVFAINPTADKSFAAFQANAMGSTTTGTGSTGTTGTTTGTNSQTTNAALPNVRLSAASLLTIAGLAVGLAL